MPSNYSGANLYNQYPSWELQQQTPPFEYHKHCQIALVFYHFWKRCFLKTSVSNGIIYTKYTQNPHIIEPPFNIATQSATYTVTACVSRWEPNVLNANNPCPAARQKQYWYFISLLRFSALKCKPNGQKNVVVLENLIIESLHMIETEL